MERETLATILIDNYNYGQFLKDAIDSALNQTYPQTEIVVVDDGSTDNSREIIAEYGDKVFPVFKENGGQASAFNAGFAASHGEIICLLDADDLFVPGKIAEVVEIFKNNPEVGWCFHPQKLVDIHDREIDREQKDLGSSQEYDFRSHIKRGKLNDYLPPCGLPATSAFCFRRSLLEKILPMPEAQHIVINDNYLKFVALGLAKGFVISDFLSIQRIHERNAYTRQKDCQSLIAQINLVTAYWMRKNFKRMSKFSNNTFAIGLTAKWKNKEGEKCDIYLIEKYLQATPIADKIMIYLKAVYYYCFK